MDPLKRPDCDFIKNFKPNIDLIYGLNEQRHEYVQAVLQFIPGCSAQTRITANNFTLSSNINPLPLSANHVLFNTHFSNYNSLAREGCELDEELRFFLESLMHDPKYSYRNEPNTGVRSLYRSERLKRACKFIVGFRKDKEAKIHFALDGIDLIAVALKKTDFVDGGGINSSTTSSELRYICRNWHLFTGNVLFYREGNLVAAPWEVYDDEPLWDIYLFLRFMPKAMKQSVFEFKFGTNSTDIRQFPPTLDEFDDDEVKFQKIMPENLLTTQRFQRAREYFIHQVKPYLQATDWPKRKNIDVLNYLQQVL